MSLFNLDKPKYHDTEIILKHINDVLTANGIQCIEYWTLRLGFIPGNHYYSEYMVRRISRSVLLRYLIQDSIIDASSSMTQFELADPECLDKLVKYLKSLK